jgi:hypothetical protein
VVNDDVNVSESDTQQALEHRLGDGNQSLCVDMQSPVPFWRLDRVARGAVVERRQNDEVHLLFQDVENAGDGERVHPNGHMLPMVLEDAKRKDDRPSGIDRGADLVGQHRFVAHRTLPGALTVWIGCGPPVGYSSRLPVPASNR